jgi:hypothetical protein
MRRARRGVRLGRWAWRCAAGCASRRPAIKKRRAPPRFLSARSPARSPAPSTHVDEAVGGLGHVGRGVVPQRGKANARREVAEALARAARLRGRGEAVVRVSEGRAAARVSRGGAGRARAGRAPGARRASGSAGPPVTIPPPTSRQKKNSGSRVASSWASLTRSAKISARRVWLPEPPSQIWGEGGSGERGKAGSEALA